MWNNTENNFPLTSLKASQQAQVVNFSKPKNPIHTYFPAEVPSRTLASNKVVPKPCRLFSYPLSCFPNILICVWLFGHGMTARGMPATF